MAKKIEKQAKPGKAQETVKREEIGSTGTSIYAGMIDEEYINTLTGTEGAEMYDKMRRSDYQVVMNLAAVKNPIKGATYEIQPASTDEKDVKIAEFVRFLIFDDMTPRFSKFLASALTMVEYGYSLFEITDKIGYSSKFGSYIGIGKLGYRSQKTIEKWNIKDGELDNVYQNVCGDVGFTGNIDARFLLRFALMDEGDNYEGISMLRACYGPYLRKRVALKLNAIGIEKYAVPTPLAVTPPEGLAKDELSRLQTTLAGYTSHQCNYIITPNGTEVSLFDAKYNPESVDKTIDSEDRRMTKAFMANFLELMGGGSYALSNDLSDFFLQGLKAMANVILEELNEKIIERYVRLNFGPQDKYPKLIVSGIDDKPGTELATAISSLVSSGTFTPDTALEQNLRKRYQVPALEEVVGEEEEVEEEENNEEVENEEGEKASELAPSIRKTIEDRIRQLSL